MPQELLDLVNQFGGEAAISAMAARAGISPDQAQSAMSTLMPMLAAGMSHHAETNGAAALNETAAAAAPLVNGAAVASDAAIDQGHSILGALFGGHQATQGVAAEAAAKTGLDLSQITALLPMAATMAAGVLAQHGATGSAPAASGGLGGMIGGLLGGTSSAGGGAAGSLMAILDRNKDGSAVDDIMGFAQRFLKR